MSTGQSGNIEGRIASSTHALKGRAQIPEMVRGIDGATYYPTVSVAGTISWTNDKGLPNPTPVSIVGPKGDTGVAGPKGDTGAAGPKGDTGVAGPQGIQGEKGDIGDTGPQGIQGPKGDKGDKGDTGPKGDKGDTGDIGPKGDTGARGETGPCGAQGIQGPKGDKGDTGEQGIQGPKGDTGDTGPKGDQGIQGIQGEPGQSGVYVGSGSIPEGCNVKINPNGEASMISSSVVSYGAGTVDGELDKLAQLLPSTTPTVGKMLKVLSVNDDGTFTCEWADGGSNLDVRINGSSIVKDGVANIPLMTGTNYGITKLFANGNSGLAIDTDHGNSLYLTRTTNNAISKRHALYDPGWGAISPANLDYSVKAAMCDGKGAAWTDTEKKSAQSRMGIEQISEEDYALLETKGENTIYLATNENDVSNIYLGEKKYSGGKSDDYKLIAEVTATEDCDYLEQDLDEEDVGRYKSLLFISKCPKGGDITSRGDIYFFANGASRYGIPDSRIARDSVSSDTVDIDSRAIMELSNMVSINTMNYNLRNSSWFINADLFPSDACVSTSTKFNSTKTLRKVSFQYVEFSRKIRLGTNIKVYGIRA